MATASGVTADSARRSFGFAGAATPSELLRDPEIDAVFIASHHHSHAEYVSAALRQGKAVFVEKPLATSRAQLESVREAYQEAGQRGSPFLMAGFNRRFAPATAKTREFFARRQEAMMVHIRINAGFLAPGHWSQQPCEGGRIVGELCHFLDWSRHLVGSPIRAVTAAALPDGRRYSRDNLAVVLRFADGSIANLVYLSNGDPSVPKEYFEVFCAGAVARLYDFRALELIRGGKSRKINCAQDKGHRAEMLATLAALHAGKESPIPFDELMEVTEASFAVSDAMASATAIELTSESIANPKASFVSA